MLLGTQAGLGVDCFLGVQIFGLPESFSIRPINQQVIEQILLAELTEDDIDTLRFVVEEGDDEGRNTKWANIVSRITSRLRTELLLAEDPFIIVGEPDKVDIELLGPRLRVQLSLLRLP